MRTLGTRLGHCLEMMVSSLRHTTSSFSVVDLKGNVFEDVIETSIFIFLPTLTNYTFKSFKGINSKFSDLSYNVLGNNVLTCMKCH